VAANRLGSEDFIRISGGVDVPGERTQEISRPRVDGVALRKVGKRGRPFSMRSVVDVLTAGATADAADAYAKMMGTIVSLYDGLGNQWTELAVRDVVVDTPRRMRNGVGGVNGGSYIVRATWTLQATSFPTG